MSGNTHAWQAMQEEPGLPTELLNLWKIREDRRIMLDRIFHWFDRNRENFAEFLRHTPITWEQVLCRLVDGGLIQVGPDFSSEDPVLRDRCRAHEIAALKKIWARVKGFGMPNPLTPRIPKAKIFAVPDVPGGKTFTAAKPCKNGHYEKYVNGGGCVSCLRKRSTDFYLSDPEAAAAVLAGKTTYVAAEFPCPSGHFERYVLSGKCVTCHTSRSTGWASENPDKVSEYYARWSKENPEVVRSNNRNRRARERNAEGSHTAAEEKELMVKQRFKCAYCRVSIRKGYHADHIIALVNGGTNYISNIQLLCQPCNNKKHVKDPLVFAQSLGFLL